MRRVLECSSKGDRRFSAFYARVKMFGVEDSIENHYQLCKRFGNVAPKHWREAKGKRASHIELNGQRFPLEMLSQWYKILWISYLDQHEELVSYAARFDDFTDMFRGSSVNCQADMVRQYVEEGRKSMLRDVQPLLKELKKK